MQEKPAFPVFNIEKISYVLHICKGEGNTTGETAGNFSGKGRDSMIKGCQKKIIHITNTGSPYFEEAYLILRRGGDFSDDECVSEMDIVQEAVKIAEGSSAALSPRRERKRRRRNRAFWGGISLCSFLFGLVMLICSLVR